MIKRFFVLILSLVLCAVTSGCTDKAYIEEREEARSFVSVMSEQTASLAARASYAPTEAEQIVSYAESIKEECRDSKEKLSALWDSEKVNAAADAAVEYFDALYLYMECMKRVGESTTGAELDEAFSELGTAVINVKTCAASYNSKISEISEYYGINVNKAYLPDESIANALK